MKGEKGYIQVKGLNVDRGIEEREGNRLTKTKDTKKKKKILEIRYHKGKFLNTDLARNMCLLIYYVEPLF